eukprot:TRINITY_DN10860_c0_g1_i3.p1 TRINITY_DN10860_c0_g1~~TRINITY_DN10860_c0_g1_i3.p1  ORF type:complete len:122 (-),score=26.27 TRINITY_DN10860_c0_g1_i3:9-338(-)
MSGIPLHFKGSFLNKYGFQTESRGSLEVRIDCIHWKNAPDTALPRDERGNTLARLATNLLNSRITQSVMRILSRSTNTTTTTTTTSTLTTTNQESSSSAPKPEQEKKNE